MGNEYRETAVQIITAAGEYLREKTKEAVTAEYKDRNDLVTQTDRDVEMFISQKIKTAFPEHTIYGEEGNPPERQSEYCWYIDPISSTANYVRGLPHWACSMALIKDGETITAAVTDPWCGETFWAERGNGAYLNGEKIHVSETAKMEEAILFLGIHNKGSTDPKEGLAYFERIVTRISEYRRFGSTALQMCYVACGRADGHMNNSNDIYAVPAGKLILEEAGGKVTDFEGNGWNGKSTSIMASNGVIHTKLEEVMRET